MTDAYQAFLDRKMQEGADHGFEPTFMPAALFDFQRAMVEYAVRHGRAALFEDCGMGKTAQFLTWAQNVIEHTNKPDRLLATATAAPNDYIELGTSSEALGYMGHMDMLNRFFTNDRNNSATRRMYGEAPQWRFKGHAETPFWRWVCSWARAMRKPSDLGFDDGPLQLPPLTERRHLVDVEDLPNGMLFNLPAATLPEQREEKNPTGFLEYAGDDSKMPVEVRRLRGFEGDQKLNKFSHWIWRRYASSIWDDIRMGVVLPYEESRDEDDEKHVHPLQLDVIDRVVQMRSNPGETVLTPFMGVGSEVYSAITKGRKGIGAELKPSYYRQAVKNLAMAKFGVRIAPPDQGNIFTVVEENEEAA